MQYFKSTAKSLWQTSKSISSLISPSRSQVQKLLDQISLSQQQIISSTKLNKLSQLSYEQDKFEQTLDEILKRIKTFQYDLDQVKKTLNVMIAINYLIKYGATGFVDQLRLYVGVFNKYQNLKDTKTYQDQQLQKQFSYQLEKVKSRANHIQVLLENKQKLLKQKQLAMLIKQKMKLYQKTKLSESNQSINNSNRNQKLQSQRQKQKNQKNQNNQNNQNNASKQYKNKMDKFDGYMQKYLWKYVDKLDGKIQIVTQKLMENFDKYILGQQADNFQPDHIQFQQQIQNSQNSNKMSNHPKQNKKQQEKGNNNIQKEMKFHQQEDQVKYQSLLDDDQLMRKLQQQGQKPSNNNLIDFQQVIQQNTKVQEQSLI